MKQQCAEVWNVSIDYSRGDASDVQWKKKTKKKKMTLV